MRLAMLALGLTMNGQPPPTNAPLSGPAVQQTPRVTLVARDFDGRLKRLDAHPVEAALQRLTLSPSERESAQRVLRERTAIFDRVLQDHFDLLQRLGAAGAAGEKAEAVRLLGEIMGLLTPLTARGPLEVEMGRELSATNRAAMNRLLNEYHDAVAADGVWEDGRVVRQGNRVEALIAERVRLLALETERAFKRVVGSGEADFEKLIAELELTPEQESRVRAQVQSFFERTMFKPTERDKIGLFLSLTAFLTADQQMILVKRIRESEGRKNAPTTPTATPHPASAERRPNEGQ